jgi:hypothetical protein
MHYREIVAVSGLSGLYQLLATKADGAIVRNLEDKSTRFVSARIHNFTPLDSIEVYTTGENVRLQDVFNSMKENEGKIAVIDASKASSKEIKEYFKSVFPEFDEERVYQSDMKKMVKWFSLLKNNDLLNFEEETEEEVAEEAAPAAEAEVEVAAEEKPKRAPRKKKEEGAEDAAAATEEKPKRTRKKKEDTAE